TLFPSGAGCRPLPARCCSGAGDADGADAERTPGPPGLLGRTCWLVFGVSVSPIAGRSGAAESGETMSEGRYPVAQNGSVAQPSSTPTQPALNSPGTHGLSLGDSVYERLLQERIIFLGSQVDDELANRLCAQILLLAAEDPSRDIAMYINSPGGSVTAGMAI